ncbi:MAG: DNA polymerase IV [Pseudomonadota bacterium]
MADTSPTLCRDCLARDRANGRCAVCGSPRVLRHGELHSLSIAHLDCDAFYASVEKRDEPSLRDQPLIVGGGQRGVVTTACYIARIRGVHSAMPMFKARALCPEAVVVKPRMAVYAEVSAEIRALMREVTPVVEPLSLDEAFLDLSGTERLHRASPAQVLAGLVQRIEREIGVTASVGLSHNKYLAKIASDLDKPRGFSVVGRAETLDFLADQPVSVIWGVGQSMRERLARDGIRSIADIRRRDRAGLVARYGGMGDHLWRLAHGEDHRRVSANAPVKSISNETTFGEDIADVDLLDGHIWRLAAKVSDRAKARALAGATVTLKLKRHDHRLLTRQSRLSEPTQMADTIYQAARPLLDPELPRGPFRLLGIGLSHLGPAAEADRTADLLDPAARQRVAAERASDAIRQRYGAEAIVKGRALR